MGINSFKKVSTVLKEEGPLQLTIATLIHIQNRRTKKTNSPEKKHKIYTKVENKYLTSPALTSVQITMSPKKQGTPTFAWIIPPPGKGSGGHINIFRFIQSLEKAGYDCTIYIYNSGESTGIKQAQEIINESYPAVRARLISIDKDNSISEHTAFFATSWETAYVLQSFEFPCKKFYFVQDFEPYFYPKGSFYALAENTYKMGFSAVTAGRWLSKKLEREYGMTADYYDFGYDQDLYRLTNYNDERNEVLFYVRPYTERRGFEMGIIALRMFHEKHPDVTINLAGWDVSDYDLGFPYNNLKTLKPSELPELYNRCAAALVLSYTNMSLLPIELLACGTVPVINNDENNRIVDQDSYFAYCNNTPVEIAEVLSSTLTASKSKDYAKKAADSVKELT